MKRIWAVVLSFLIIFIFCGINFACSTHTTIEEGYDLLRIHIRANSNDKDDQAVKLLVRDEIAQTLSSSLSNASSLEKAKQIVSEKRTILEAKANEVLRENDKAYECKCELAREYFPTRAYKDIVVKSGYYDALVISLGEAKGDNWWCIIYPQLCYETSGNGKVVLRSKLKELWDKYFG
jgi:stage II sporulation protein R